MHLHVNQLHSHLNSRAWLPVYLIHGDIPLLVQEARDAICKATFTAGYQQRELFSVEANIDWDKFLSAAHNLSLLSEKTLLELRNPTAKFDAQGTKLLLNYVNSPPPDKILLITTDKLTAAQQKSSWFNAIEKMGAILTIWPISMKELPTWVATRLKQANLQASKESIYLIAELTEGNLLATQQAIEKLRLLYPNTPITEKEVATVVSDNACFTIFDLAQYALAGSKKQIIRVLHHLRFTKVEATLVLWAITRELRDIYAMRVQVERGRPISQVIQSAKQTKKPLLQQVLQRLNGQALGQMLLRAEQIDHMIKGIKPGNAWEALETLCLSLASA